MRGIHNRTCTWTDGLMSFHHSLPGPPPPTPPPLPLRASSWAEWKVLQRCDGWSSSLFTTQSQESSGANGCVRSEWSYISYVFLPAYVILSEKDKINESSTLNFGYLRGEQKLSPIKTWRFNRVEENIKYREREFFFCVRAALMEEDAGNKKNRRRN